MIVIDAGAMFVRILGRTIRAAIGDVLVYPADIAHEEWTDSRDSARTYWISFSSDVPADALPLLTHDATGRIRLLAAWLVLGIDLERALGSNSRSFRAKEIIRASSRI